MAEMVVRVPAHLEKFEREVGLLRRNSTGGLGIQMAKYKVMSRYLSVRKSSCHDACKGVECEQQTTKTRTSLLSKSVTAASEKIPEVTKNVKLQIRKKPLSSRKHIVNFKWRTTGKAWSQGNAHSMSRGSKLGRRRYSEINIPGKLPISRGPLLDSATNKSNQGIRMAKDTGASVVSKKKAIRKPGNLRSLTASHGEEMPACTKRLAVSGQD